MSTQGLTETTKPATDVRVGDVVHYGVHWGKVQSVTTTPNGPKIAIGLNGARIFRASHVFRALVAA